MFIDFAKFSIEGIRKRRLRSLLTMIGIFIGIAAVEKITGIASSVPGKQTGSNQEPFAPVPGSGNLFRSWG